MCQVNGSKRIALFSPHIPEPKRVMNFLRGELHLKGERLDPSLALNPSIVDVKETDALYIPPYWHHAVVPIDGDVGFTLAYCWSSPWHKFGDFGNYYVRKLYRDGFWPVKIVSFILPFIAVYSSVIWAFKKRRR